MKHKVLWILWLCLVLVVPMLAQTPTEWTTYTNRDRYLFHICTDRNTESGAEAVFCENLRQMAIVGLAQQIEVSIDSGSTIEKRAIDGRSHTAYSSVSTLSTNADLQLVTTDVHYNRSSGEWSAIAWIDKQVARTHYLNELNKEFSSVESVLSLAEKYAADGYAQRATAELEHCAPMLSRASNLISRISLFGASNEIVLELNTKHNTLNERVALCQKRLQHALTICLRCSADLFGGRFATLGEKVKGGLAKGGCNFVASAESADWLVVVEASAREYTQREIGGTNLYTSYVDATISITNCHTGQVVCSDAITTKSTHTISYREAARSAYGDAQTNILDTINKYIN